MNFSKKYLYISVSSIIFLITLIYIFLSIYITTLAIKATRKVPEINPSSVDLDYTEDIFVTEDNIKLSGWFIKNENPQTVIMIHGVDSNKSDGYMLDLIKDVYEMDYSIFAFDLRAHGDSEGNNLGLAYVERKDLKASIDYLRDSYSIEEMVLYGISYGGTIVLSNSSMDPSIKGIIADSPFYDLPELMAAEVSSRTFIPESIAKLLKFGIIRSIDFLYDIETNDIISGLKSISNFQHPILLYHCLDDDRIPISHSDRINEFSPEGSKYLVYEECEHAKGYEYYKEDYLNNLKKYIEVSFSN
ncbi:MAG: hypothetical protein CL773_04765 [Chloroflexi bacterium]|nr:hypothetical protein [Chloroflexota bacterium]